MTKRIAVAAMSVLILAAAPTLAQCGGKKSGGDKAGCCAKGKVKGEGCSEKAKAGKAGCGGDTNCVGELVRFKGLCLPRMSYEVKGERLCCPKKADELVKAENAAIKYVVADKVYADKAEALAAHAKALDEFLNDVLTVKYAVGETTTGCDKSATALAKKEGKPVRYTLASFTFADQAAAEKAAKQAREASEKVALKVMVGDETFGCPVHAADAAKQNGKKVEYCVGKTKTACEATAKVELARERIKAALTACEENGGKPIDQA